VPRVESGQRVRSGLSAENEQSAPRPDRDGLRAAGLHGRKPPPAIRRRVVGVADSGRLALGVRTAYEDDLAAVPHGIRPELGRGGDPAPCVGRRVVGGGPRGAGDRLAVRVEPADEHDQLMAGPRSQGVLARGER
jgi:hypothetical protein